MIKKFLFTILLSALIIPLVGIFSAFEVYADGSYDVKYIEDDGDLTLVESYNTYEEAFNKMQENTDYVVTQADSLSPSKIIAMNSGLVYSYPYRSGSNTIRISEKLSERNNPMGASTYVWPYAEMTYHSTTVYFDATCHDMGYGHGYVYITLNGFDGYVDLEYVDLVPTKYIENHITITLGGNSRGKYSTKESFEVKCSQHYYYAKQNGNYRDLILCFYENYPSSSNLNSYEYKIAYGVAPDFMQDGNRYYSEDGINFYSDSLFENYVGTYYNYYQFVPLRTYSNIKAETINSYIAKGSSNSGVMLNTGSDFISNQNTYGVNGAIIAAMGIHESGWGKSNISNDKYNLFGWAAYDADTTQATSYNSVSECIAAQMGDNLANYLDVNSSTYFSQSLGNKGGGFITKYASDPYWAEQIAQYYYGMDKADNNNNGNLSDYNSYNLALVNSNTAIKKEANEEGATLYYTQNKTGYQKNLIVIVLDSNTSFIKTQLSNPIINGEVCYPTTLSKGTKVEYDAANSIGYIKASAISMINGNNNENVEEESLKIVTSIRNVSLTQDGFYIKGIGCIQGLNFLSNVGVQHELVLVDYANENNNTTILLETIDSNGYDLNDGKNYTYSGFEKLISYSEMPTGNYGLMLRVTNGQYTKESYLQCAMKAYNSLQYISSDYNYHLSCNQLYAYRMEMDIEDNPIDYSTIYKASMRKSLLTIENSTVELSNDGTFTIGGHGFMYYLDYSDDADVNYRLHLVQSMNNEIVINAQTLSTKEDEYALLLGLENNLDNIRFIATYNIFDLQEGEYVLYVENTLSNEGVDYKDILEFTNKNNIALFENVEINNKLYSLVSDSVRNRLILKVSAKVEA